MKLLLLLLSILPSTAASTSALQKFLHSRWNHAKDLAQLEQQVDAYNANTIASSSSAAASCCHRRLICLPLDATTFNPPPGVFSHNHVQTGDKMSLPTCFQNAVVLNNGQVPWLFRVRRIEGVTSPRVEWIVDQAVAGEEGKDATTQPKNKSKAIQNVPITEHIPLDRTLDSVIGGPIDFRAPPCYVFLPHWMFRALGIRPLDIVAVDYTPVDTIPRGSLVQLRPHAESFAQTIANPQAVLETELKHYSSLTAGTTIAMEYNGERYWFDVVQLRSAPKGEKVPMVILQDSDVSTDFLPSREAKLAQLRKREERRKEMIEEGGAE